MNEWNFTSEELFGFGLFLAVVIGMTLFMKLWCLFIIFS